MSPTGRGAMPAQLSGGEQQRVSIARALVNRPPVILADEPTAPLDSERALAVIRILERMARQYQTAIIVVTHDEKIIPTFERIYQIRDGRTLETAGEGRDAGGSAAAATPARTAAGEAFPGNPVEIGAPLLELRLLGDGLQDETVRRCARALGRGGDAGFELLRLADSGRGHGGLRLQ